MRTEYTRTYTNLFDSKPRPGVAIEESSADILAASRGFMNGLDCTLQLQVGCPGGCLYCYVSTATRLAPTNVRGPKGSLWGTVVRNKSNPSSKLRRHLERRSLADKTIYWSGVTDPYAAAPHVTRGLWQALIDAPPELRPRRIAVRSRFRPDRDAEIIAESVAKTSSSDGGPPVVFSYSIGTDRDGIIRAWERATLLFGERVTCVRALRAYGLFVVPTVSPFGCWNNLERFVREMMDIGAAYITVLFPKANSKSANSPKLFVDFVQENHPELLDETWQAEKLERIRSIMGRKRVIVGQQGFGSLTAPHKISDELKNFEKH